MEREITSVNNESIRIFGALAGKKGRKEYGMYLVEGMRLCEECVNRIPEDIVTMLYTRRMAESTVVLRAKEVGIPVWLCADHVMQKACASKTSQGVACAVRIPGNKDLQENLSKRIIALDGISDPGNMGTILRTAWAFGVGEVLLGPGCADVYAPKVVRAGMGAHFALKMSHTEDLANSLHTLAHMGYDVIGAHLMGSDEPLVPCEKRCVVIGSEARGMSEMSTRACTRLYRIPMEGDAESLNAAVAAGILMDRIFHT